MKNMAGFSLRKLYFKIMRQEGTPESIGRGVALGLFTGFILPVGFQTIPALALAVLFKANKALTWLFTCVSNPATVLVLYPIQCYTGSLLILRPLKFAELSHRFAEIVQADTFRASYHAFLDLGSEIIITFFVGGLFYGVLLGAIGYFVSVRLVRLYRDRMEKRRLEREARRAAACAAGKTVSK